MNENNIDSKTNDSVSGVVILAYSSCERPHGLLNWFRLEQSPIIRPS